MTWPTSCPANGPVTGRTPAAESSDSSTLLRLAVIVILDGPDVKPREARAFIVLPLVLNRVAPTSNCEVIPSDIRLDRPKVTFVPVASSTSPPDEYGVR